MRDLIKQFFQEALDEIFADGKHHEEKAAVERDPRKEKFFDNMTQQMRQIEKKGKVLLTRKKIKDLVKDFVKLFGQAAIKAKEIEIKAKESRSKIFLPQIVKKGFPVRKSGIILPNGFKH